MTIKYLAGRQIEGLSSDTKPTTAEDGSIFTETDTGKKFVSTTGTWTKFGGNLDSLTNVDNTTTPPSNNDVLTYTTTGNKWKPAAPPGGGSVTASSTDTFSNKTISPTVNTIPFMSSYTYTIYQDAGVVKALNNKTGAIASNTNLDPLITTILGTLDPNVEIQAGDYNLSGGFSGWVVKTDTHVFMHRDCMINVPAAYTGDVWKLSPSTSDVFGAIIEGGEYGEQGTKAFDWTCIAIKPTAGHGVVKCMIRDMIIWGASKAIHINTDTLSWGADNIFSNIEAEACEYLVKFDHTSTWTVDFSGLNQNLFIGCMLQSTPAAGGTPQTLGGVTGVVGDGNIFISCTIWDLQSSNSSASSMTIGANARGTRIIGGLLSHRLYTDAGYGTINDDRLSGLVVSHTAELRGPNINYSTVPAIKVARTPNPTPGFEAVASIGMNGSTDTFTVENGNNLVNAFSPIWRSSLVSTNMDQWQEAFLLQGLIKNTIDTDTVPVIAFSARTETTPFTIAVRPLFSIRNHTTDKFVFYTDKLDMKGNKLVNVSEVAQNPLNKRWGTVQSGYGTALGTVGVMDGLCQQFTATGLGTNTTTFDTTEGKVINYQTSNASGVVAGLLSNVAGGGLGRRLFAGRMVCRFKLDSTTSARFYFGLTSATALPIGEAPLGNTDNGIIVGFNAADTNYQVRTNDGATSVTTTQMGGSAVAKTNATAFHTIEISWTASGNYTVSYDGVAQTISSDLPATTADLYPNLMVQTSAAVQRTFTLKALYIETDK
jgi:hypothetical protein